MNEKKALFTTGDQVQEETWILQQTGKTCRLSEKGYARLAAKENQKTLKALGIGGAVGKRVAKILAKSEMRDGLIKDQREKIKRQDYLIEKSKEYGFTASFPGMFPLVIGASLAVNGALMQTSLVGTGIGMAAFGALAAAAPYAIRAVRKAVIEKRTRTIDALKKVKAALSSDGTPPKFASLKTESSIMNNLAKYLSKHRLSAEDLGMLNAGGKTILMTLTDTNQLSDLFRQNKWKNLSEMANVYNALPERAREQLNGKNGNFNYIQAKNMMLMEKMKPQKATGR